MISRREFLGTSLSAGAALALAPPLDATRGNSELAEPSELLRAQKPSSSALIQRAIPSTGERLPVISFGPRSTDTAPMKEILTTMVANGATVVDMAHSDDPEEACATAAATELGIQNKCFWTIGLLVRTPDPATARAELEARLAKLKLPRIDLVMVSALGPVPTTLAFLREMKQEGRVRYIGIRDLATPPYAPDAAFDRLASIMRSEPIDFVATDYMAGWPRAEEKLLPLAMERKIAFMAYFTFDRGRLFKRVGNTPLPEWAAEFDAKTWPQFFLKYVLSHPGVTVARTGTTKAAHMLDNIGGGIGRLPDAATRKRMAALVDSLPPAPSAGRGGGQPVRE